MAVVVSAAGLSVDRFDAAHPRPSQLMYALDADTGEARWLSDEADPGEWTGRHVTGREDLGRSFTVVGGDLATGPAVPAALPPPALTVEADIVRGDERRITLRLRLQRPVRLVSLRLVGPPRVLAATVEGREIPAEQLGDGSTFALVVHGPPAAGVEVGLTLRGAGPVQARVVDGSDGLDALPGFVPRPADVGIAGSHEAELVLVARTYPLG